MMNKKWTPHIVTVAAFVLFTFLGLACESSPSSYSSGSSGGSSSSSSSSGGSSSGGGSTEYTYTFHNNSSYTVNLTFAQIKDVSIPSGETRSTSWNSAAATVYYTPSDMVNVSYSDGGFTMIFTDK
jgi:hypothetical protein